MKYMISLLMLLPAIALADNPHKERTPKLHVIEGEPKDAVEVYVGDIVQWTVQSEGTGAKLTWDGVRYIGNVGRSTYWLATTGGDAEISRREVDDEEKVISTHKLRLVVIETRTFSPCHVFRDDVATPTPAPLPRLAGEWGRCWCDAEPPFCCGCDPDADVIEQDGPRLSLWRHGEYLGWGDIENGVIRLRVVEEETGLVTDFELDEIRPGVLRGESFSAHDPTSGREGHTFRRRQ